MADLTNLKSCQHSNVDENMIQLMDLPDISETIPPVISFSNPEVMAIEDDEPKQVDQIHGEELEKTWKFISCGNKSSRSASVEQEGSRHQTSDIMAIHEDEENKSDYSRSNDRITKEGGWCMPEHLLFEILILLPVAALLRFKSVCKSWYALISSSDFIAHHLDHNRDEVNLIGFHGPFDEHDELVGYTSCLLRGNKYEMYSNFDCENFVEDLVKPVRFSSDGIVCLWYSHLQEVDLWNPALKHLRRLPKSPVSYQFNDHFIFYGSGYSVGSTDYKVVRTIVHKGNVDSNVVEVYSLRDDSWRTILENGVLSFRFISRPVSKNGTCFWIASDNKSYDDDSVVSFDLDDETFGTMPLPENASEFSVLDFLGDKLVFISGLHNPITNMMGCRYYEIWLLNEYGVKELWSKIWKIGPTDIPYSNSVYYHPFGLSKNGDYLLLTNTFGSRYGLFRYGLLHSGKVYLHKLGTQENEYIKLQPLGQQVRLFARCMESLISVKRVNDAY